MLCMHTWADPATTAGFIPTQTAPDISPRPANPGAGAEAALPPSNNLDGLYLWLGPLGAASWVQSQWDSTWGVDATVVRIREHELLGAIGASLGGARWTVRGGGRAWLDFVIGTPVAHGWMAGLTAGPIVELSEVAHPLVGGSIGAWMFVGVTPYVRVGVVQDLGTFTEIGLHVTLPVLRKRTVVAPHPD